MSWTQPVCVDCWNERNPERQAVRTVLPDRERCCYCGQFTTSGIYVRIDPAAVPYPAKEKR